MYLNIYIKNKRWLFLGFFLLFQELYMLGKSKRIKMSRMKPNLHLSTFAVKCKYHGPQLINVIKAEGLH